MQLAGSSDEDADDRPNSLRVIVAREARRLAEHEASSRTAAAAALRHSDRRVAVARAITNQGLSTDDLREFVEMGDDFAWQEPLSRAKAIEHLERLMDPHRPNPPLHISRLSMMASLGARTLHCSWTLEFNRVMRGRTSPKLCMRILRRTRSS